MRCFFPLLVLLSLAQAAEVVVESCDVASTWYRTGGTGSVTVSTTTKQEGAASITLTPTMDGVAHDAAYDLSVADHVRVWISSGAASGKNITLILTSENTATTGWDYYYYQIPLLWTGWRQLWLPRSQFGVSRSPLGWNQVTSVQVSRTWGYPNAADVDRTTTVQIDDLRLLDRPAGQATSFADLLAALDGRSEFTAIRALGTEAAQRTALANYFRNRTSPTWYRDPVAAYPHVGYAATAAQRSEAAATLGGAYTVGGYSWNFGSAAGVDWAVEPTIAPWDTTAQADTWVFHQLIHRMAAWTAWSDVAWEQATQADATPYANAFVAQLRSWINLNPMPTLVDNSSASTWRTIEAGIRTSTSWPTAWATFLRHPSMTDDDVLRFATAFLEHGRYLLQYPTGDNWLTMEMNGLYTCGVLFPEFTEAASWRTKATGEIAAMVDPADPRCQFQADGFHNEQTPGYHDVALTNIEDALSASVVTGRTADFPQATWDALKGCYTFPILFGGGTAWEDPTVNDSWAISGSWMASRALVYWSTDPLFNWARNRGRSTPVAGTVMGSPPAETDHLFSSSGWQVARTSWAPDGTDVWFDVGRLGSHEHQDKLQVIVWPYGRDLLFDGGGGDYDSSVNRRYAMATNSHNTVMVDGLGQSRLKTTADPYGAGDPATTAPKFVSTTAVAYGAGWYQDGWADRVTSATFPAPVVKASHRREVLLWRDLGLVIVLDTLTPVDGASHDYQARWHLRTTNAATVGNRVVTTDAGLPNLSVIPLLPVTMSRVSGQTSPEFLGWDVRKAEADVPCTTVLHARSGTGVQRLATVLAPIPAGGTDPVGAITDLTGGGWRLAVGGGTLEIVPRATIGADLRWVPASGPTVTITVPNQAPTLVGAPTAISPVALP